MFHVQRFVFKHFNQSKEKSRHVIPRFSLWLMQFLASQCLCNGSVHLIQILLVPYPCPHPHPELYLDTCSSASFLVRAHPIIVLSLLLRLPHAPPTVPHPSASAVGRSTRSEPCGVRVAVRAGQGRSERCMGLPVFAVFHAATLGGHSWAGSGATRRADPSGPWKTGRCQGAGDLLFLPTQPGEAHLTLRREADFKLDLFYEQSATVTIRGGHSHEIHMRVKKAGRRRHWGGTMMGEGGGHLLLGCVQYTSFGVGPPKNKAADSPKKVEVLKVVLSFFLSFSLVLTGSHLRFQFRRAAVTGCAAQWANADSSSDLGRAFSPMRRARRGTDRRRREFWRRCAGR